MLEFRKHARQALEAVRKGERLLLTYRGVAVARLEPVPSDSSSIAADDALLRLDDYAMDGPGGALTNEAIDRSVYGS